MRRVPGLAELARSFALETSYDAMDGTRRTADDEAVLAVLHALGAQLDNGDARAALRHRREALDRITAQPVQVSWNGAQPRLLLRLPHRRTEEVRLELRLESGDQLDIRAVAEPAALRARAGWRPTHSLRLQQKLPLGYHTIVIETRGETVETLAIAAPRRAYSPAARGWGAFMPLYALRSDDDWGVGDFFDLQTLARWVGELGGACVSTLPLLATFLDAQFEPSPYAPVSRLFWNELFLDVAAVPGWSPPDDRAFHEAIASLRARDLVDYRRVAALKRRELQRLVLDARTDADAELQRFTEARPRLADYARFRAVCDRLRSPWQEWPARLRDGDIADGDFARDDYRYHLFAQWHADRQLGAVRADDDSSAAALYLDMPLGVHPHGYDAWRFRDLFADGVAAGAPPDPLFTGGQNWGFRPLHPEALRANGYGYFIETLRHHLHHAAMLRLDHVMAFHRVFWVPDGMSATRGVYVRYPADEMFAVLVLESARHRAVIVGEDLGTVPLSVRRAMDRHGVLRMHVVQYEVAPDRSPPAPPPPENVVASLNTHDMPTFAGFWSGADIDDQLVLGLIDETEHRAALHRRRLLRRRLDPCPERTGLEDAARTRDALLAELASSAAAYVLVSLEDLWLEQRPQNVPGTSAERPNWQRRARRTMRDMLGNDEVNSILARIDQLRHTRTETRREAHG